MRLSGGPTTGRESGVFSILPRAGFTYIWQCQSYHKNSEFSATLEYGSPSSTAQLADTSRGDQPLGCGRWVNLDQINGQVVTQPCSILVSAKHCRWSLTVIFGSHALLKYNDSSYAFSLRFDPSQENFGPGSPSMLDTTEAKAVGGSSGELVGLVSGTENVGYLFSLRAVKVVPQKAAVLPADVEGLVSSMTGWQRIGAPRLSTIAGLTGYEQQIRWPGPPLSTGVVSLISTRRYRYAVCAIVSPGHPELTKGIQRLLQSLVLTK
jgi:hypothetical protein